MSTEEKDAGGTHAWVGMASRDFTRSYSVMMNYVTVRLQWFSYAAEGPILA